MNYLVKKSAKIGIKSNSKGFTLVELLVAIVVISIISSIVISSAARAQKYGRDGQRKSDLRKIQTALQQYYSDQGFYPSSLDGNALAIIVLNHRTMSLDSMFNGLTNCSGRRDPCPPASETAKTYLATIPVEPAPIITNPPFADNHYCYEAWTDRSMASHCGNTTSDRCQYYRIYSRLETTAGSSYSCTEASGLHPGGPGGYTFYVEP